LIDYHPSPNQILKKIPRRHGEGFFNSLKVLLEILMSFSDADKKKITEAFREAVNKSPYADMPAFAGAAHPTGREFYEMILADDDFYKGIEEDMAAGKVTLDEYIAIIKKADPFKTPG
jgi:hypothetical protein